MEFAFVSRVEEKFQEKAKLCDWFVVTYSDRMSDKMRIFDESYDRYEFLDVEMVSYEFYLCGKTRSCAHRVRINYLLRYRVPSAL